MPLCCGTLARESNPGRRVAVSPSIDNAKQQQGPKHRAGSVSRAGWAVPVVHVTAWRRSRTEAWKWISTEGPRGVGSSSDITRGCPCYFLDSFLSELWPLWDSLRQEMWVEHFNGAEPTSEDYQTSWIAICVLMWPQLHSIVFVPGGVSSGILGIEAKSGTDTIIWIT